MKTWEMIKELTENPKKKFESTRFDIRLIAYVNSFGSLVVEDCKDSERQLSWSINREWEEVKEPVSWEKAFEAGLHGKRIKPVGQDLTFPDYENLIHVFKYLIDRPHFFNEIILGNWYIED